MNAPRRLPRTVVDGVLLLDKPVGITSNAALQTVRRQFNAAKAGHTGTLDPLASGLLPLCFGEATKFSSGLLAADKRYDAVVRLGIRTDTADAEGQVLETCPVHATREQVHHVLEAFRGDIDQTPPMHSALKRDGRPLYAYAREGIHVDRAARRVRILDIALTDWSGERFSMSVHCSKGTYIRTLAEDIGQRLGCGAHLAALRRTGIGSLSLDQAVKLDDLTIMATARREACLLPVDRLLGDLPSLVLGPEDARRLRHGQPVGRPGASGERLRVTGPDGQFIGVCLQRDESWLWPQRLIAEAGGMEFQQSGLS